MYISINIFSTPCSYCPRFTLFPSRLNVGFTTAQPWTNYGPTTELSWSNSASPPGPFSPPFILSFISVFPSFVRKILSFPKK